MRYPIVILLIVVLATSCSKDDPSPVSKIIGAWQINTVETKVGSGMSVQAYLMSVGMSAKDAEDFEEQMTSNFIAPYIDGTLEFKSDGSWSVVNGSDSQSGTWKISDDQKSLTLTGVADSSDEFEASVVTLTDTILEIELPIDSSFTGGLSVPGAKVVLKATRA